MKLPEDWQAQAMAAIKEMQRKDVTRAVFGIMLPQAWRYELEVFARSGELRKLLGVKAVAFKGKEISRLEPPTR